MNREIKFRAWDKEEKKMHYSDSKLDYGIWFSLDSGKAECLRNCAYTDTFGDEHDDWQPFDNIMQNTGLPDKKDKEIYEGDIMEDKHLRYRVVWDDEEGAWSLESIKSGARYGIGKANSNKFEIIGNIFANPELLELVS